MTTPDTSQEGCSCDFCVAFRAEADSFFRRIAMLGIETNTRPTAAVMAMGIACRAFAQIHLKRNGGTIEQHINELMDFFTDGLNTQIAVPDNLMPTPGSVQ